ncbi:hypothetical protein GOBAR_DD14187 [Gossypium barbadense]|nr:hypothetical protein GOBAR_DD14187 [Gossypium barbadense]
MERGSSSGPCKSSSVSLRNLVAWVFEIYIALNVDDLVEDILAFYDAKCVLRILVSDTPTTDRLIWHFNPDGRYSVRSAYHVVLNMCLDWSLLDENTIWAKLWRCKIPLKVCSNEKGIPPSPLCSRCGKVEGKNHVLLLCSYAQAMWIAIGFSFGQSTMTNIFCKLLDSATPEHL